MRLQQRLARLERRLPPPSPPSPQEGLLHRRWRDLLQRWQDLLEQALALMTAAEQERVHAVVAQGGQLRGPYAAWLRHLGQGWCRLPALPASVMKDLLLAWLDPA